MTASPCIAVCRLDARTGLCIGCGCSIDEIADWPNLTEAQRRAIIDRLKAAEPRRPR